jgi:hypothetical protein
MGGGRHKFPQASAIRSLGAGLPQKCKKLVAKTMPITIIPINQSNNHNITPSISVHISTPLRYEGIHEG